MGKKNPVSFTGKILAENYLGVIATSRAGKPVAFFMFGHAANNNAPAGATLSKFVMTST